MKRVYKLPKQPLGNTSVVAVGVYASSKHIGLLHQSGQPGKGPLFLHLGDHCELANEDISSKVVLWVDPEINQMLLYHIAGWCRLISELHGNGTMPYGFSSPDAFFDDEGHISEGKVGLTCATLVLAIYHQVGIKLLDYSTWPTLTAEDKAERTRMKMHISINHPQQAAKLDTNATKSRYSPLQVAGASAAEASSRPVKYRDADYLGAKIQKQLKS